MSFLPASKSRQAVSAPYQSEPQCSATATTWSHWPLCTSTQAIDTRSEVCNAIMVRTCYNITSGGEETSSVDLTPSDVDVEGSTGKQTTYDVSHEHASPFLICLMPARSRWPSHLSPVTAHHPDHILVRTSDLAGVAAANAIALPVLGRRLASGSRLTSDFEIGVVAHSSPPQRTPLLA